MKTRAFQLALVAVCALDLVGCDRNGGDGKTDASSAERISAALDPCAEGRGAFAARVCADRELAALDGQVREALIAGASEVFDAGAQLMVQNQNRWLNATRITPPFPY